MELLEDICGPLKFVLVFGFGAVFECRGPWGESVST